VEGFLQFPSAEQFFPGHGKEVLFFPFSQGIDQARAEIVHAKGVPCDELAPLDSQEQATAGHFPRLGEFHAQEKVDEENDVVVPFLNAVKTAAPCPRGGTLGAGLDDPQIGHPGIGFGKTLEHNLEILRRLGELKSLGYVLVLGTSRKSFIGRILDMPEDRRVEGTAASVALGIAKGADIVRVHDVAEMVRVCRVADAILGKE